MLRGPAAQYDGRMKTLERVRRSTADHVNEEIDDCIANTLYAYQSATPAEISRRLNELEREWDIERWLETNASALALTGVALGTLHDRRWLALSGAVLGFLFLHGTRGWCPPLPVLRRLGVRTRSEIDRERFALKFIRGDFRHVRGDGRSDVGSLLAAVEA